MSVRVNLPKAGEARFPGKLELHLGDFGGTFHHLSKCWCVKRGSGAVRWRDGAPPVRGPLSQSFSRGVD